MSEQRKVCIPGHGRHYTGLGHVADLATAMAQCIGREHTKGQVYNIQVSNKGENSLQCFDKRDALIDRVRRVYLSKVWCIFVQMS